MGLFSEARNVKKALSDLDATVTREVKKNGGKPINQENAAYRRAKANKAIAESGKVVRTWYGGIDKTK